MAMNWAVQTAGAAWGLKATEELAKFTDVYLARAWGAEDAPTLQAEAEALTDWIIAEGGILPKAAQILAERPDVVEDEGYRRCLSKCQVSCEPVGFDEIEGVLKDEGVWKFLTKGGATVNPVPVSTGSIGQVHFCDAMVVKVSLDRKKKEMESQFGWLDAVVSIPGFGKGIIADIHAVVQPIKPMIIKEFDLRTELTNMKQAEFAVMRINTVLGQDLPPVVIPETKHGSEHTLVMEKRMGTLLKDLLVKRDPSVFKWILEVCRFLGACVLKLGWFHCDPHPGNVMVEDGRLVMLDWGCVCKLDRTEVDWFRLLLVSLGKLPGSEADVVRCMKGLGFVTKNGTEEGMVLLAMSVFAAGKLREMMRAKAKAAAAAAAAAEASAQAAGQDPPAEAAAAAAAGGGGLSAADDPPEDIPPRMAQLIRVVATLEGVASRAGFDLRVLTEWVKFVDAAALTSLPRRGRTVQTHAYGAKAAHTRFLDADAGAVGREGSGRRPPRSPAPVSRKSDSQSASMSRSLSETPKAFQPAPAPGSVSPEAVERAKSDGRRLARPRAN
eukprot:TRINITY_DN27231_c0_g1_i1.p1 TRINITY_DN27231_c0_g1~~TRINITY_DN27231_c0_g1_i1.p1  ORF type:complete len:553 (-),score=130.76 TRINITY_DN27231_c0_g1_i1:63-1721(-)